LLVSVGWAKARKRRAHRLAETLDNGGHASLCPPYGFNCFVIASEAKQSRAKEEAWIATPPSAPRNDDVDRKQQ
jgi:hypothetical protein